MSKKKGVLLLVLFWLAGTGFKWPEISKPELNPYVRYRLSKLPLLNRWIKPPPPPQKAYQEAQKWVETLERLRAEKYFPEDYQKILKRWQKGQKYYQEGRYSWAVHYFKKVVTSAKELAQKTRTLRDKKRQEAWQRLENLRKKWALKKKDFPLEKQLKVELALWRLENLIQMEDFELFAKEVQELEKNYAL